MESLCESAARSAKVLGLDVEDLDLANRRARVTAKGRGRRQRLAVRSGAPVAPAVKGP